jgi:hypothetical protein
VCLPISGLYRKRMPEGDGASYHEAYTILSQVLARR